MITKFSRDFWATAVKYKGSDPKVLRDYDILKGREEGKSITQLAIKFQVSRVTINEILKKYR